MARETTWNQKTERENLSDNDSHHPCVLLFKKQNTNLWNEICFDFGKFIIMRPSPFFSIWSQKEPTLTRVVVSRGLLTGLDVKVNVKLPLGWRWTKQSRGWSPSGKTMSSHRAVESSAGEVKTWQQTCRQQDGTAAVRHEGEIKFYYYSVDSTECKSTCFDILL